VQIYIQIYDIQTKIEKKDICFCAFMIFVT